MNKTAYYKERRTYQKYDNENIIGYLNEEVVENYLPENALEGEETWPVAYKYTGTEADGGTVMPCRNPEDHGDLANAIIRAHYTESQELAIHRHAANGDYEENPAEYEEYDNWCKVAVELARLWLEANVTE